jgi:hypothetical protein
MNKDHLFFNDLTIHRLLCAVTELAPIRRAGTMGRSKWSSNHWTSWTSVPAVNRHRTERKDFMSHHPRRQGASHIHKVTLTSFLCREVRTLTTGLMHLVFQGFRPPDRLVALTRHLSPLSQRTPNPSYRSLTDIATQ